MQFPFGSRSLLHAFIVGNLCFACFASQTLGLCSAIPSAPLKFVARLSLCCIVLYSVIFCFACFASQTSDLGSAFPLAPVKSVTRFCYAENFVLLVLPKKHRVCAVLLPRLPSSFFTCLSLFCFIQQFFALRVLPHQHRACAVLSLWLRSSLHPFGFLCFIQFASVMRALPDKLRFVQ